MSLGRVGPPKSRKLSKAPLVPCWLGEQSAGRAYGAPNGLHGPPQCQSPPRNSKAVTCACPSTVPSTSASGLAPVNAGPLASTWASGYSAHPLAGTNVTGSRVWVPRLVIVNPSLALPSTCHSAAGLGALAPCGIPLPVSVR